MPVNEIILKVDLQKHDRMATAKETAEQVVRQTFCASTNALCIYLKSDNSFLTCDSDLIVVALGQQSLHTSQSPQSNGDICSFPNPIASNCALLHAEQCLFQLLQEQGQHGRTWETMLEESHGLRQDRYCNGISH